MKRIITILLAVVCTWAVLILFVGCKGKDENGQAQDINKTKAVASGLQERQPTPTDIDYSLERYNLIRRAYWVNGQREKANALPCQIEKPLGHGL